VRSQSLPAASVRTVPALPAATKSPRAILDCSPGGVISCTPGTGEDDSRFSYVYVIVDQQRLNGVTWGQPAEYVAMVALALIKPTAHLGDAPTTLKLFDGSPQPPPAGMSAWDTRS